MSKGVKTSSAYFAYTRQSLLVHQISIQFAFRLKIASKKKNQQKAISVLFPSFFFCYGILLTSGPSGMIRLGVCFARVITEFFARQRTNRLEKSNWHGVRNSKERSRRERCVDATRDAIDSTEARRSTRSCSPPSSRDLEQRLEIPLAALHFSFSAGDRAHFGAAVARNAPRCIPRRAHDDAHTRYITKLALSLTHSSRALDDDDDDDCRSRGAPISHFPPDYRE